MKILFLGTKGVPLPNTPDRSNNSEGRVEALAGLLAKQGHEVTVTSAKPFVASNLRSFNGARLFSVKGAFSSWGHAVREILMARKERPQVIHAHGWKMAALSPLLRLLNPTASLVWTIDSIPEKSLKVIDRVLRIAGTSFDAVTSPTREVQYQLLNDFYFKADYVPDGYMESEVPLVPLNHFGIRKNQKYFVTTARTAQDIRFVAKAYKQSRLRNKLIVLNDMPGSFTRLLREFPFLKPVGPLTGRPLKSILGGSSGLILSGDETPRSTVLTAMDQGVAILSVVDPLYQETAGVSAQFVHAGDFNHLAELTSEILGNPRRRGVLGGKARKRARNHFHWNRIIEDYTSLYHYPITRIVPIDSARASFAQSRF